MKKRAKLPLRTVFFCGAESPYGFAHLKPLLEEKRFNIVGIVLATRERWEKFSQSLSGESIPKAQGFLYMLKHTIRNPSPRVLLGKLRNMVFSISQTDYVSRMCKGLGIRVWKEFDVNSPQFIQEVSKVKPDLFFCSAYPQIFKQPLLTIPRYGAVNSHPSILPRYRGAHPIFWAIAMGETESGVSIHYMQEKIDAGPVIAQIRFSIGADDNYSTVYQKAISLIPQLIRELADFFESGVCHPVPQDDSKATYFREDRTIHRAIFWSVYSAQQIRNLVRAANGRAFFWFNNKKVFVLECRNSESNRNLTNNIVVPPGTIVDTRDGIAIKVKDGVVTITNWRVDPEQKLQFSIGQVLQ